MPNYLEMSRRRRQLVQSTPDAVDGAPTLSAQVVPPGTMRMPSSRPSAVVEQMPSDVERVAEEVLRRIQDRLNHFGGGGYVNVADADSVFYTRSGTSRSAAAIFGDVVNVKNPPYNAVGDGVVNDTSAIQAALNVGKEVLLPSNATFLISASLVPQSGSRIVIAGGTTIKILTGAAQQTHVFSLSSKSDVTIEGAGTLDGNKSGNPTGRSFGVEILDSTNITIRGLTIQNFPGSDAAGTNQGDGIYIGGSGASGSTGVLIDGCKINANVRQGISVVKGSRIRIIGNEISGTTGTSPGAGIDIEADAAGNVLREITIVGNVIQGNNVGVVVNNTGPANSMVISGNTFRANLKDDVQCNGNDVVIGNNFIDVDNKGASTGAAIRIYAANNISVVANTIVGNYNSNERGGIVVNRGAGRISIIGNTVRKTFSGGVSLGPDTANGSGASRSITVIGNLLEDCVDPTNTSTGALIILPAAAGAADLLDVVIDGNCIFDSRSAGNEADLGIQVGNQTDAMLRTWRIFNNSIEGPAIAISGVFGDAIKKVITASATLDFDLSATASQDLTITVNGAQDGDTVALSVPNGSVTADTLFWSWVSSANTVTVRAMRIAGTPNPASGTFRATVFARH